MQAGINAKLSKIQDNSQRYKYIIGKTKSAILKNEKYIFWCFPAISGASV